MKRPTFQDIRKAFVAQKAKIRETFASFKLPENNDPLRILFYGGFWSIPDLMKPNTSVEVLFSIENTNNGFYMQFKPKKLIKGKEYISLHYHSYSQGLGPIHPELLNIVMLDSLLKLAAYYPSRFSFKDSVSRDYFKLYPKDTIKSYLQRQSVIPAEKIKKKKRSACSTDPIPEETARLLFLRGRLLPPNDPITKNIGGRGLIHDPEQPAYLR
jgi:hypothetical protein